MTFEFSPFFISTTSFMVVKVLFMIIIPEAGAYMLFWMCRFKLEIYILK